MKEVIGILLLLASLLTAYSQPIHKFSKEGNIELVFNLIEKNSKLIDTADDVGYTPLHWALIRENWDIAKLLIGNDADVKIQGTDGGTPLHCAANHENTEIIEFLMKEGAQIDIKNLWGNTPLCLASQRGCNKTVQFLISKGADFSAKSNEGWTALHYAYKCGHKEVQKVLIQAGASDTIKDSFGKVPSDYTFERPVSISINPQNLMNYVGYYNVGGNSTVRVFISDNKLMLEEYAIDEIYPIATDQFYDFREPWKIRFFRKMDGEVDKIAIDFQRQTIVGKKVKSKDEVPDKPRLGIKVRPLNSADLNEETLKKLFFDEKVNAYSQLVTFVQEGSVSFKAGLLENDIILEFNNVKLLEPGDLFRLLYDVKSNTIVPVRILQDTKIKYINMKF